jgi:hypothetical protein
MLEILNVALPFFGLILAGVIVTTALSVITLPLIVYALQHMS